MSNYYNPNPTTVSGPLDPARDYAAGTGSHVPTPVEIVIIAVTVVTFVALLCLVLWCRTRRRTSDPEDDAQAQTAKNLDAPGMNIGGSADIKLADERKGTRTWADLIPGRKGGRDASKADEQGHELARMH